jgi:hypothetical protein
LFAGTPLISFDGNHISEGIATRRSDSFFHYFETFMELLLYNKKNHRLV